MEGGFAVEVTRCSRDRALGERPDARDSEE